MSQLIFPQYTLNVDSTVYHRVAQYHVLVCAPGLVNNMAELSFVRALPDDYSCMICAKLLNEPHLTDCCGQHFCQVCLDKWFKKQGKKICPHCRSESFSHMRYLPLKRKVDLLRVCCTYKKNGCEEITTVGKLKSHTDKCGFVPVACTQNCRKVVLRKDLEQHCNSTCLKRKIKCKYCGEEDLFEVIVDLHTTLCQEYPVKCPKGCTRGAQMKRKDLPLHAKVCPLEQVDCDFRDAGCDAVVLRKDLDFHLESNTQLHLKKMMAFCREQGEEHKKLKEECKRLSSQIQMLTLAEPIKLTDTNKSFIFSFPSSKGWVSPPFYVLDGYKFCVKHKEGYTASLLLLKGEHDDRLRWPIDLHYYEINIYFNRKQVKGTVQEELSVSFKLYNSTVDRAAADHSTELATMKIPQNFTSGITVELHYNAFLRFLIDF